MKLKKIALFILLAVIIFAAGVLAGSQIGRHKISELNKLMTSLNEKVKEASDAERLAMEQANKLTIQLEQVKKNIQNLENLNVQLKGQINELHGDLVDAITNIGDVGSNVTSASRISSKMAKLLDKLLANIDGYLKPGETGL